MSLPSVGRVLKKVSVLVCACLFALVCAAGYGGEQSLISLRGWATRLGPPSVILYVGCENDFEDDLPHQPSMS